MSLVLGLSVAFSGMYANEDADFGVDVDFYMSLVKKSDDAALNKIVEVMSSEMNTLLNMKVTKFMGKEYKVADVLKLVGGKEFLEWAKTYKPKSVFEYMVMSEALVSPFDNDEVFENFTKNYPAYRELFEGAMVRLTAENKKKMQVILNQLEMLSKVKPAAEKAYEALANNLDQYDITASNM